MHLGAARKALRSAARRLPGARCIHETQPPNLGSLPVVLSFALSHRATAMAPSRHALLVAICCCCLAAAAAAPDGESQLCSLPQQPPSRSVRRPPSRPRPRAGRTALLPGRVGGGGPAGHPRWQLIPAAEPAPPPSPPVLHHIPPRTNEFWVSLLICSLNVPLPPARCPAQAPPAASDGACPKQRGRHHRRWPRLFNHCGTCTRSCPCSRTCPGPGPSPSPCPHGRPRAWRRWCSRRLSQRQRSEQCHCVLQRRGKRGGVLMVTSTNGHQH